MKTSHPSNRLFQLSLVSAALIFVIYLFAAEDVSSRAELKPRHIRPKPQNTVISPNADIAYVAVKFTNEAIVRPALTRAGLALQSRANLDMTPVTAVLQSKLDAGQVDRLFQMDITKLDNDRARRESISGRELADLAGYYTVAVSSPVEAAGLVDQLNSLEIVELAYPVPRPSPASIEMATPDFVDSQLYLRPAPQGVDADYSQTILGGDGSGIKVIDIEGGWRVTHEDLAGNPPFVSLGVQLTGSEALSWRNHGTAVMGEIMGSDNGIGITGISPGVQWGYSSIGGQSTPNALLNAGSHLDSGDVILIELHAPGPHYNFESRDDQQGYVCMEYWQANFDAIEQLSIDGIIVCEAAGNGSEDFDDINLYGTLFDTTSRNSHAIMCGAGGPPFSSDLARLGFSNYGERVNLQGYGSGVATTGYGGMHNGGSEDSWYTRSFSGTSSASPIITGSVAALQGAHKAGYGYTLDADQVRTVLVATGTPQTGDTSEHIGPRPNLQVAIDEVLGVSFFSDTGFGMAPLPVQFTGASARTVNNWIWDFGDGDSSNLQSPQHTYEIGGLYDVTLTVEAVEGDFSTTRVGYVAAIADTVIGEDGVGPPGGQAQIDVYMRNSLPTWQISIPVEWSGPLDMNLDSASTAGLRSESLTVTLAAYNPFGDQATYVLSATQPSSDYYLAPGSGPVLSLFFSIGVGSGTNPIIFDGYGVRQPNVITDWLSFEPVTQDAAVSLCALPGDADASNALNIADVTYIISYIFGSGPAPNPLGRGDADCSGGITIADVTFLINFIFAQGVTACECAP